MTKEEIFAIIDDELEKRKDHTFLLWDFPNDVKKRIEEVYQSEDNAKNSTATETLLAEVEMLSDCAVAMQEAPRSNWCEYAENEAELDLKLHFAYLDVKEGILKKQEQEKILKIIKEKCLHTDNLSYVSVCIDYDMYKEKISKLHDTAIVKIDWTCKEVLDCLKILTKEEFDTLRGWTNGIH